MEDILIIPPIRQSLEDIASAKKNNLEQPGTEKSWYLYWQKTGDQVNLNTDKLNHLITYGTHADRPPAEDMPAGSLYMETDRSNVVYQNIDGVWTYLTGTMWGTITPDLRPTDLGVHDGGFDYRGTDDNREFIWSQTQWIEVTAVRYGIHSARPAPADVADGSVYVESDRGGVIYQQQAGAWKYLAGTMWGTISPDQRPTDLGPNDAGFDYRGTDQQREFIWSGSAWVEVTSQTGNVQQAGASASLTLSTSTLDVPGTSMTLARAGRYWVNAVFDFWLSGSDTGFVFTGFLNVNGGVAGSTAIFVPQYTSGTGNRATVAQQWVYNGAPAGAVLKLQANKNGGTGNSVAAAPNTNLVAIWISP